MGSLAQQHADGAISEVQIEYCGEGFDELDAINNTLLQGLLGAVAETTVNAVNAPVLARERGIALSFTESDADAGYRQLVRLRVRVGDRYHSFSATTFFDGEPRLVEIDGFSVELILTGVLIIFGNYDKPGVIGGLGSIFGEHGINIAHFSLGRRRRGGEAMGILAVDERVDDGILALIAELPNMQWVSQIVLD